MSRRMLKTLTVAAPAAFIALFELARHSVLVEDEPMLLGNLLLLGTVVIASFFFSRFIFGVIDRTQRESLRRNEQLSALNSLALAVSESSNLEAVVRGAINRVVEITTADAGEVFLWNDQLKEMRRWFHVGLSPETFAEKHRFRVGEGLPGAVALGSDPIFVQDIFQDPMLVGRAIGQAGFRSAACLALRSQSNLVGAICMYSTKMAGFTRDETRLLTSVSYQIAVGIDNARLQDVIRGMATVEERERIAREMHDGIAQVLSYVSTKSQATRQFISTHQFEDANKQLVQLEQAARDVLDDVGEAILNLRATVSADRGIVETLRDYVLRFSQMSGIKTTLEVEGDDILLLAPTAKVQTICIIQEALTNVRKHARAGHAHVHVSTVNNHIEIMIEDWGEGFDTSDTKRDGWPRLGLQTMRERAESIHGSWAVESVPSRGTRVTLSLPMGGRP
jgi:nitrate/nitrite-specific signal transduction histidine kinase